MKINALAVAAVIGAIATQSLGESYGCYEAFTAVTPKPGITGWSPVTPSIQASSEGPKALIYFSTYGHVMVLTRIRSTIGGQSHTTWSTNEMVGQVIGGTQFTGSVILPFQFTCGQPNNWVDVKTWLYEPGEVIGSTNFYATATAQISGK